MTKFIPLEETEVYLLRYTSLYSFEISDILSKIRTIDPIAIIDKMIEEIDRYLESPDWGENKTYTKDKYYGKIESLKELKSRLSLTQK